MILKVKVNLSTFSERAPRAELLSRSAGDVSDNVGPLLLRPRMKKTLSLVLVLSLSAAAAESPYASEEIPQVVERPASESPGRFALAVTSASLLSAATTVAAGFITLTARDKWTQAAGKPNPMSIAAGLAIGGATQLLVQYLLMPELFRISGDSPAAARAGWWRWARWPALTLAASTLAMVAGAAVENKNYGSGQVPMMGAAAAGAASSVGIDVLGVIGAVKGVKEARKKRRLAALEAEAARSEMEAR